MLGDDQPALPKDDRDWVYLQPETMDPIPGVEAARNPQSSKKTATKSLNTKSRSYCTT